MTILAQAATDGKHVIGRNLPTVANLSQDVVIAQWAKVGSPMVQKTWGIGELPAPKL